MRKSGERALWRAVIYRALRDATGIADVMKATSRHIVWWRVAHGRDGRAEAIAERVGFW